jgi:hypothetical protein
MVRIRLRDWLDGLSPHTGGANLAILRYYGAAAVDPTTSSTAVNPLVEADLVVSPFLA